MSFRSVIYIYICLYMYMYVCVRTRVCVRVCVCNVCIDMCEYVFYCVLKRKYVSCSENVY
jgi:hypothetical protein